jgi:hypothetical protein
VRPCQLGSSGSNQLIVDFPKSRRSHSQSLRQFANSLATRFAPLTVLKLESRSHQPGSIDAAFLVVAIGILLIRWGAWFAGDKCDSFGGKTSAQRLLGFTGLVVVLAWGFWTLAQMVATQQIAS